MRKIHNYVGLFITALGILILLSAGLIFYNNQSRKIQKLMFESQSLLVDWKELQNDTYQILLGRYTVTGTDQPPRLETWRDNYKDFSIALNQLENNPQIRKLPDMPTELNGIIRVWRYTEVQLNNAHHFFSEIVQSGLGEKVMVNGFLHTLYKLRMNGQLAISDIFLLDDTIYALEILDDVSKEFDILFSSVIGNLNNESEQYLQRIRIFSFGVTLSILVIVGLYYLLNNQFQNSQANRAIILENQKSTVLKQIVEKSSEENLEYFQKRKEDLGILLDLQNIVVPIALQIDDYSKFSHHHNIREQEQIISTLKSSVKDLFSEKNLIHESFRYDDDLVAFLVNLSCEEEYDDLKEWVRKFHNRILDTGELSVSLSIGDTCSDAIDLDQDFSDLLGIVGYRYLSGKGSFLYNGSASLTVYDDFNYPHEKEKHFIESIKTLNAEEALRKLNDLFDYACHYGPQNMKRLIFRLTTNLSAEIEFLEKTYHIQAIDRMTPTILKIQNQETIDEIRSILTEIINDIIERCRDRKEDRHDQTIREIKTIIEDRIRDFGLSADIIAEEFQLTASYINRMFKEHTSYSIAGYINRERLLQAERFLRTTDHTIGEIAELSGFSSLGTFFRLFKKKYGRSPREYQKEV